MTSARWDDRRHKTIPIRSFAVKEFICAFQDNSGCKISTQSSFVFAFMASHPLEIIYLTSNLGGKR